MSLSEVLSGARLIGPSTRERNVHGSGNLAQTLIRHGLVDEYHLWFFPVLGQGKRLFADGTVPATLRLVDSKISKTGVFMGTYEPAGEVVTARSRVSSGRMNRE